MFRGIQREESGSILILTLLVLVGALTIAMATSSVAVLERKLTDKSQKSVSAFQAASSGVEWAMKKINDAGKDDRIRDVFGEFSAEGGKIDCPSDIFGGDTKSSCYIYLLELGEESNRREVITDSNLLSEDIIAIRSVGLYGFEGKRVNRAVEAYAFPNCGAGEERVDYEDNDGEDKAICTQDFEREEYIGQNSWDDADEQCEKVNHRLCTRDEFEAMADANLLIHSSGEWTADEAGSGQHYLSNGSAVNDDEVMHFRCCRDR